MPRLQMKPRAQRPQAAQKPRYEAKWVNGTWTVFDHVNFGHGMPLGTYSQAARVADELNSGKRQWAAK